MRTTKADWSDLLAELSDLAKKPVSEFHTSAFYAGNGPWRNLSGTQRREIITAIFRWIGARKHEIVYASVVKDQYDLALKEGRIPPDVNTLWMFMAFHIALSVQRKYQGEKQNKGNTLLVFDGGHEQARLCSLTLDPPQWSDSYYARAKSQGALNQIIDVPLSADSKHIGLVQVADCLSFVARRHAEMFLGLSEPRYVDEDSIVAEWMDDFFARSISPAIYPKKSRNDTQNMFYQIAPASLRDV